MKIYLIKENQRMKWNNLEVNYQHSMNWQEKQKERLEKVEKPKL